MVAAQGWQVFEVLLPYDLALDPNAVEHMATCIAFVLSCTENVHAAVLARSCHCGCPGAGFGFHVFGPQEQLELICGNFRWGTSCNNILQVSNPSTAGLEFTNMITSRAHCLTPAKPQMAYLLKQLVSSV